MTPSRYDAMFERLGAAREGAFIPFAVLGDPDFETSLKILQTLAGSGADALELGIPFSDPVADGPVIQRADERALSSGFRPRDAFPLVKRFRERFPEIPLGLLVYANIVWARGMESFYAGAAEAGVDSVLVADAPTVEALPFAECALKHGIQPVLIAAGNGTDDHLAAVASMSRGYTYVVTRAGVTGADEVAKTGHKTLIGRLETLGAPPCVLGFGISRPEHVSDAVANGAAGAISGSAVVSVIERNLGDREAMIRELGAFVSVMKQASRCT